MLQEYNCHDYICMYAMYNHGASFQYKYNFFTVCVMMLIRARVKQDKLLGNCHVKFPGSQSI